MVNETMLDNAHEIAKEELADIDNISKTDIAGYRKRLNGLLTQLEDEAEADLSEDDD